MEQWNPLNEKSIKVSYLNSVHWILCYKETMLDVSILISHPTTLWHFN